MDAQREIERAEEQCRRAIAQAAREAAADEEPGTDDEVVAEAVAAMHEVASHGAGTAPMERMEAMVRLNHAERRLRPLLERADATAQAPLRVEDPAGGGRSAVFWVDGDGEVQGRPGDAAGRDGGAE